MEEYESLAATIVLIDAAIAQLEEAGAQDDACSQLHDLRNDLNGDRIALLGNGSKSPFHVSDLKL